MPACTYLGTKYGGWALPLELLSADSTCYCAGCGEDISFDLALIEKVGCHVFGFDPTPASIKHVARLTRGVTKYHFYPVGLWARDARRVFYCELDYKGVSRSLLVCSSKAVVSFSGDCKRLSTLMKEFGHDHIDLLKMDIEGAEYAILDDMRETGIQPRIICVEFHGQGDPSATRSLLESGYDEVHRRKTDVTFVLRND